MGNSKETYTLAEPHIHLHKETFDLRIEMANFRAYIYIASQIAFPHDGVAIEFGNPRFIDQMLRQLYSCHL